MRQPATSPARHVARTAWAPVGLLALLFALGCVESFPHDQLSLRMTRSEAATAFGMPRLARLAKLKPDLSRRALPEQPLACQKQVQATWLYRHEEISEWWPLAYPASILFLGVPFLGNAHVDTGTVRLNFQGDELVGWETRVSDRRPEKVGAAYIFRFGPDD